MKSWLVKHSGLLEMYDNGIGGGCLFLCEL